MMNRNREASVCVTIVTYNSGNFIAPCLDAVFAQSGASFHVVVVDNHSTDATLAILDAYKDRIHKVIRNPRNVGFAEAQNQAIAAGTSEWVLTLNPDAILLPGFLEQLLAAGRLDPRIGTVCGRLLSIRPDLKPPAEPKIDSAGIYFTPQMRHFDRGWNEPDDGRYQEVEYVFGASAAAALYRREMIEDIAVDGEFFDPAFFAYREDADVAWRAQLLGWRCLYLPSAASFHVRSVVATNRHSVPAVLNMHSVKNRFLMRIKNMTGSLYKRYWLAATLRDALVIGGCLLYEQTSLPAFWHVAKRTRRAIEQRRSIMTRRRVSDEAIALWFSPERPVEVPEESLNFLAQGSRP